MLSKLVEGVGKVFEFVAFAKTYAGGEVLSTQVFYFFTDDHHGACYSVGDYYPNKKQKAHHQKSQDQKINKNASLFCKDKLYGAWTTLVLWYKNFKVLMQEIKNMSAKKCSYKPTAKGQKKSVFYLKRPIYQKKRTFNPLHIWHSSTLKSPIQAVLQPFI